jgi:hypothetical protein
MMSSDKVRFTLEGNSARLSRSRRLLAGFGAVKRRRKPEDYKALREEFEDAVAVHGRSQV